MPPDKEMDAQRLVYKNGKNGFAALGNHLKQW